MPISGIDRQTSPSFPPTIKKGFSNWRTACRNATTEAPWEERYCYYRGQAERVRYDVSHWQFFCDSYAASANWPMLAALIATTLMRCRFAAAATSS